MPVKEADEFNLDDLPIFPDEEEDDGEEEE